MKGTRKAEGGERNSESMTFRLGDVAEMNPRGDLSHLSDNTVVGFVPMNAVSEITKTISSPETRRFGDVRKGYTPMRNGDVIVAKITPCFENGKLAIVDLDQPFAFGSTEFHVFRPNGQVDSRLLYHLLSSELIQKEGRNQMKGAAGQKRVPSDFFRAFEFRVPRSLPEQKRLAKILDKADEVRRKLQQSLRLSDDFLRSVFLDMFGDPVTNPKGLKIARMGDYSDQLTGYAFKSSEYVPAGDGIRLCRGTNVLPSMIDWSDRADWPEDQCSQLERYQLIEGDIVVAMDRPWISSGFKTARITERDVPSLLVQRVARIRAKSPLSNNYLFTLLNQGSFARHCKPTETTIPHISPIELREFPVAIPSKAQLEQFDKIYLKLGHAKDAMTRKANEAEDLFSSLPQRAFRGEL